MDREQGNFRNSPLAAEWGMTEPGKAEQPPMSNSSCIPGTVGMSKIISSGEESWPGIMSHCPGWVPSCQQGHVPHRAAADAATSKNGKVPDAGNLRKKMYKQKRNFLFCPFTQPSLMRPVYYLKSNENMGSR